MDFQDAEQQTAKQPSKIVVGELNIGEKKTNKKNNDIIPIPIEDPDLKQSWNTTVFFFCSAVFIHGQDLVSHTDFSFA